MTQTNIIVFDIDGTLTDSVPQHHQAFERAPRSFHFPALRTDWSTYRHHSDRGIFEEAWEEAGCTAQPDYATLEERFRVAFDEVLASRPLTYLSNAPEFLLSLSQTVWVPVFATGSLRYGALLKLSSLNVPFDEELLVTASEYSTREDIVSNAILRAKDKHGIRSPGRIVSVGDGIWDLKTAQNLGLEFIGIGSGEKAELLRASGAVVHAGFDDGLAL